MGMMGPAHQQDTGKTSENMVRIRIVVEDSQGNLKESGILTFDTPDDELYLASLKTAATKCFPELEDKEHVFGWVDEEGDYITIGSEQGLKIALANMKENMLKIHVKIKQEKKKDEEKVQKIKVPKQFFANLRTALQSLCGATGVVLHEQG